MLAHRVSLEISLGRSLAPGMCALHKCDNTLCVNPAHLFEGTQKDNRDDCRSKGRLCPSEEYESAKLTDKIVRFIKKHYRPWSRKRRSMYAFSEMFDISVSIVSDIIHGKRWRHVT